MSAISHAYDQAVDAWLIGAEPIYRCFARVLVGAAPLPLRGLRVLDVGVGTGAVSAELLAAGARPLALDLSPAMLACVRGRFEGIETVAADGVDLPLAPASMDGSVAAFVLNHLADPHRLLSEAARVTRPGGSVLAMTYAGGDRHPAQAAVEGVAASWGWSAPTWYQEQRDWAQLTDSPDGLRAQAARAGLLTVSVRSEVIDAGPRDAEELAGWRLGLAHLADFVGALTAADRRQLAHEAARALGPGPHPLWRAVLILSSTSPA